MPKNFDRAWGIRAKINTLRKQTIAKGMDSSRVCLRDNFWTNCYPKELYKTERFLMGRRGRFFA